MAGLQAALEAERERAHGLQEQLAAAQSAAALGSRTGNADPEASEAASAVPTPWDAVLGADSGDESPAREPRTDCRGPPHSTGESKGASVVDSLGESMEDFADPEPADTHKLVLNF